MKFLLPLCFLPTLLFAQLHPEASGAGGASSSFADTYSILNNPGTLGEISEGGVATGFDRFHGVEGWNTYYIANSKKVWDGGLGFGIDRFGDDLYNLTRLSAGFGHRLGIASLGGAIRYQQLQIEGFGTRSAWVFDFGGLVHLGEHVTIGSGFTNISQSKISSAEYLPSTVYIGVRFHFSEAFQLVGQIDQDLQSNSVGRLGMMYSVRMFRFQVGFMSAPVITTAGAGIDLGRFDLDVSIHAGSPLGLRQFVGLNFTW